MIRVVAIGKGKTRTVLHLFRTLDEANAWSPSDEKLAILKARGYSTIRVITPNDDRGLVTKVWTV